MSSFRFVPRLAGGLLLSALLFACDSHSPVEAPETRRESAEGLVSPQQIQVPIHAIFSGPPNREPGQISLDDPQVFVQILDVRAYLGRPASPNDVRIGETWETGTPAESFLIIDIDNDGLEDIQVRFNTQQLINNGHLGPETTLIVVWGRDQTTGQLYRGQEFVTVLPPPGGPAICWDNGGFITHPNGGTGAIAGQHVSMSDPVNNTAGSNVLLQPGGPHFRIADDFIVEPGGCAVAQVVVHAYQTGAAQPTWTSANLNIRSGSVTGTIVASATSTNWQFTGVYRTFNGVLNDANRPIFRIIFNLPSVNLAPGTYWIDWQVAGGTSAWAPYVTLPGNPPGASNTQTVFQNGQQMFNAAGQWQPTLAPPGAEIPFQIRSTAAPPLSSPGAPVPSRPSLQPADYSRWPADRAQ